MFCLLAPEPEIRADMAPPADWLTASEAARLQSFGTEARRDSFLAGRWLARRAMQRGPGAGTLPALAVADSGACEVVGVDGLFVSITHSAGMVASVAAATPVGIDIEGPARPRDYLALARKVHGPAQREALEALPPAARALPFIQWWTLKEAWLKARGQGLDFALMRELVFDADSAAADVAFTSVGDLVLAIAAGTPLPPQIEGLPGAQWERRRARRDALQT